MTTKKKDELSIGNLNVNTNTNVNNNTNNIHVHIKHPKKSVVKNEKKPNWILRAIVLGGISLVFSLIGYYMKNKKSGAGKPAVIENSSTQLERDKK